MWQIYLTAYERLISLQWNANFFIQSDFGISGRIHRPRKFPSKKSRQTSKKRAKADFVRQYIADDKLYQSYDTFEQVQSVKGRADEEKAMRDYAMELIFGAGDMPDD